MLDDSIEYAYRIIFRDKVADTVRKKKIVVLIARFICYLHHIIEVDGYVFILHFKYNKTL